MRQATYLRALATLPEIEIHFGHYLSHVVRMPIARPVPGKARYVEVLKTEEKGSDVNLATQLLSDAYEARMKVAVLITNDSDLLAPVDLVRTRLGVVVGILNPQKHPAFVLARSASFFKQIRSGVLAASQFPSTLADVGGTFSKPAAW